jgi:hypothetical protein
MEFDRPVTRGHSDRESRPVTITGLVDHASRVKGLSILLGSPDWRSCSPDPRVPRQYDLPRDDRAVDAITPAGVRGSPRI